MLGRRVVRTVKVRATGWAGHKEGTVVAENLPFLLLKNKKQKTAGHSSVPSHKSYDSAAVHSQDSVLLGCDACHRAHYNCITADGPCCTYSV